MKEEGIYRNGVRKAPAGGTFRHGGRNCRGVAVHRLPLIVTTNIHAQKMMSETELARQRIYSRVLERCHPIEVVGAYRRTEAVLKEYTEMNHLLGL